MTPNRTTAHRVGAILCSAGLIGCATIHAAVPVAVKPAQVPSPDPSLALFTRVCTGCHAPDRILAIGRTPEQWSDEVAKMVDKGAMATDAEQAQITAYLAKTVPPQPAK
jgi:hypothetical protein